MKPQPDNPQPALIIDPAASSPLALDPTLSVEGESPAAPVLDVEALVADYRRAQDAARAATETMAEDPEVRAAEQALEEVAQRLDAARAPYRERVQDAEDRQACIKGLLLENWPDPTTKTLRGEGWQVQKRITPRVVVKDADHIRAIRLFDAKGVLYKAIRSVTWDPAFLKSARDMFGPGDLDGRLLLQTESTTSISVSLDKEVDA